MRQWLSRPVSHRVWHATMGACILIGTVAGFVIPMTLAYN